jgi:hypothetical protein
VFVDLFWRKSRLRVGHCAEDRAQLVLDDAVRHFGSVAELWQQEVHLWRW